jgi:hypothetical protein
MMADDAKIRERAHKIWEAEGRPHGRDREHWERAAREIEAESKKKAGKAPAAGRASKSKSVAETYRDSRDAPGATGETIPVPPRGKSKPIG